MAGTFQERHIGTDAAAQRIMLDALGYDSVDALVQTAVPASIHDTPRETTDIPPAATEAGLGDFSRLPAALKVVLENMLRFEDGGFTVSVDDIRAFAQWAQDGGRSDREIAYRPARVLMQDFTGVPAVVDLAAMRDGIKALGGDAQKINPLNPVDLVIDHSVMVDEFGNPRAFQRNVDLEYARNMERYQFLKWGMGAFQTFSVVPPGIGIIHQVNLEFLAKLTIEKEGIYYPDTLVGTDSHTTMINGLGVVGWGVGGIEAEAAMLGAMMIDNRLADDLVDRLEPVHFYEPVHGRIFAAIKTLRANDMLATPVTLRPMFDADEGMRELGGPAYLAGLTGSGAGLIGARQFAQALQIQRVFIA